MKYVGNKSQEDFNSSSVSSLHSISVDIDEECEDPSEDQADVDKVFYHLLILFQ